MTSGHSPMHDACITGLASFGPSKQPSIAFKTHGENNTRTDLLFQWEEEAFVVEMKRPESGLAHFWATWPWSPSTNPNTITAGTKGVLSQACRLILLHSYELIFFQVWGYIALDEQVMLGLIAAPPTRMHLVACSPKDLKVIAISENLITSECLAIGLLLV
jgi:hypothetical protein